MSVCVESPALRAVCCVVLSLFHWNGMPPVPFQLSMVRFADVCAVLVLVVAWQAPPVSTQLASQLAIGLIDTMPEVGSLTRSCAVSSPHELVWW